MVIEISLPRNFLVKKQRRALPFARKVKHCFGGKVNKSGAKGERPVSEASDGLIGDQAAKFSSQSFDLAELLSDTFKQC